MEDEHISQALKKVTDPYTKPYPYFHVTTIGRLKSILTIGLVAPNYLKKILKKNVKRNFDSSWNEDSISLFSNTSPRKVTAPNVAVLVNQNMKVVANIKSSTKDKNRPSPKEVLAKNQIEPEYFTGLVIGGVGWDFELERSVIPKPLSLSKVTNIMKSLNPKYSLPVYFRGRLVWPKL